MVEQRAGIGLAFRERPRFRGEDFRFDGPIRQFTLTNLNSYGPDGLRGGRTGRRVERCGRV